MGHAGSVEIEARWQYEAYVQVNPTYVHGLLVFATKHVNYMFYGSGQIYFLQTNSKCFR